MDDMSLLVDLHRKQVRQGPGGVAETKLAISLSGLQPSEALTIADIGCGTGASSMVLATQLKGQIKAIDLFPNFLSELQVRATTTGVGDHIETLAASMEKLPFEEGSLDAIWSEGAIYNIGFETGIRNWRHFLKRHGILAVSELTWLTSERPDALTAHWTREYPEVDTASAKLAQLETHGYKPLGYFVLPQACWKENYYSPLQVEHAAFLERHQHSEAAKAIIVAEQSEIDLYEAYREYFGYGFYIAQKV
ncbi:MAG: class I SAM-dependent methyltransferase [Pseudomonadota bacterium]